MKRFWNWIWIGFEFDFEKVFNLILKLILKRFWVWFWNSFEFEIYYILIKNPKNYTWVTVKELNNYDSDGYYGSLQCGYSRSQLVTPCHSWPNW